MTGKPIDVNNEAPLRYSILDPTGNITALVESRVDRSSYKEISAEIMRKHPEVEQVGFVSFDEKSGSGTSVDAVLNMAGGEFCGNASMSAAALYLIRKKQNIADETLSGCEAGAKQVTHIVSGTDGKDLSACKPGAEQVSHMVSCNDGKILFDCTGTEKTVMLMVSGSESQVEVKLERTGKLSFDAGVHMPEAVEIYNHDFSSGGIKGFLPVVRLEGISHIIIEHGSEFYSLLNDTELAEETVKIWCDELSADGLGLLFISEQGTESELVPLVYVPASGTVFWENSCASGSAAAGMYFSEKKGLPAEIVFKEPGGCLRVKSDRAKKETWIFGKTSLVRSERL